MKMLPRPEARENKLTYETYHAPGKFTFSKVNLHALVNIWVGRFASTNACDIFVPEVICFTLKKLPFHKPYARVNLRTSSKIYIYLYIYIY